MRARIPELSAAGLPAEFSAEQDLAAAFAGFVCQMHIELGGEENAVEHLARAAFLASRVLNEGHACVDLSAFAGQPDPYAYAHTTAPALADWLAQLRASPVVAAETEGQDAFRPLVLDGAGRLYLYRYRAYERRLASGLRELNIEAPIGELKQVTALLNLLFPAGQALDRQKAAAATALQRSLAVISGGPGTGKTTTVVKILAILLSVAPHLRIALAAPTGKAAMRMQESIRSQLDQLAVAAEVKSQLPATSFTLHRLLGYRPGKVQFRHRPDNPLAYDVVVVDEASMLDVALAAKLVDALRANARLILLGDKDQLASVETGVVFGAICAAALSTAEQRKMGGAGRALGNAVVLLEHSYRFSEDSGIGRFARFVNAGDADGALALLHARESDDLNWWKYPKERGALADELWKGFAGYFEAVGARRSAEEVLTELDRYRVLCAVREGEFGALALNAAIAERFCKRVAEPPPAPRWYAGRPVLVTRNDYALRLFNGDVGVTLPDASGNLLVHFPKLEGGTRAIAPSRLTDCETAFAMTVHKAQGSEFDRVDLVLPIHESRVLTRQLLYTAATRARSGIRLWGSEEMIRASIARAATRYSGLTDLLG